MEFREILFNVDQGIATATLNRPDIRNAITHPEIIAEIKTVCKQVNQNVDIKVLIVTAVDPAYSSGGNVKDMKDRKGMFQGSPAEIMEKYRSNLQDVLLAVYNVETVSYTHLTLPTILRV